MLEINKIKRKPYHGVSCYLLLTRSTIDSTYAQLVKIMLRIILCMNYSAFEIKLKKFKNNEKLA